MSQSNDELISGEYRDCAVSKLQPTLEHYSLDDWRHIFADPCPLNRASRMLAAEEPIEQLVTNSSILFVWTFKHVNLENGLQRIVPISVYKTRKLLPELRLESAPWEALASLIPFIVESFPNHLNDKTLFKETRALTDDVAAKNSINKMAKSKRCKFKWSSLDKGEIICLVLNFETENRVLQTTKDREAAIVCNKICDYLSLKNTLMDSIPWAAIYQLVEDNPQRAWEVYRGQKKFRPDIFYDGFLWPWQRSISKKGDDLSHSSIRTVSLVGDIRHSTVAMSEFEPAEEYANFIDEVIHISRQICLDNDAYFDKETGDGFVVHFCGTEAGDNPYKTDSKYISRQAIKVSIKLLSMTQEVIVKYQKKLGIELDGLGLSIGIHMDDATWLCNQDQIRAIGPSVVRAARLCDEACSNEILVTPPVYRAYGKNFNPTKLRCFERINIKLKEIPPEAIPMVYSLKLRGSEK